MNRAEKDSEERVSQRDGNGGFELGDYLTI